MDAWQSERILIPLRLKILYNVSDVLSSHIPTPLNLLDDMLFLSNT